MKRRIITVIVSVLIVLTLSAGLFACGRTDSHADVPAATPGPTPTQEPLATPDISPAHIDPPESYGFIDLILSGLKTGA